MITFFSRIIVGMALFWISVSSVNLFYSNACFSLSLIGKSENLSPEKTSALLSSGAWSSLASPNLTAIWLLYEPVIDFASRAAASFLACPRCFFSYFAAFLLSLASLFISAASSASFCLFSYTLAKMSGMSGCSFSIMLTSAFSPPSWGTISKSSFAF